MSSKRILIGRKQIEDHLNLSWPTIKKLYDDQGLPLVKMAGQWGLHVDNLRAWMGSQYDKQHTA